MKIQTSILVCLGIVTLTGCKGNRGVVMDAYAPEESALNLVKITDEAQNSVLSCVTGSTSGAYNYATSALAVCGKEHIDWSTPRVLSLSPDGKKMAYATRQNKSDNIMVRNSGSQGVSTQRTFRNVGSFCWGKDGRLYFTDINGENSYICSVDAEAGSMMAQHTNGNVKDFDPVLSDDNNIIYFTRSDATGPAIWSLNKKDGTLTSCTRGYNSCIIPGQPHTLYVVRNTTNRRSEIWRVNYEKGEESLVLSDENRSFSNPVLSPDGEWIACVGNTTKGKKKNLDIFVVLTDGSHLTQLTYHPENDTNPTWSADGRSIYFISSRATEKNSYNVWKMNFNLY